MTSAFLTGVTALRIVFKDFNNSINKLIMTIIDWPRFNENFQYYDHEIIMEVVNMFLDEYDDRMSGLQKNIGDHDYKALAFNAHSLKSVIGNYMAPQASELAGKLEELAKNNSEEEIPETFSELVQITQLMLLELKGYAHKS